MSNTVIDVEQLTKIYRTRREQTCAVDAISFNLKEGEVLGLLGPNGAGKTTTIQMLLGTLKPTSGEIHYFGKSFERNRVQIMQKISFASSYTRLPSRLTVRENLNVFAKLYRLSSTQGKERSTELLKRFDVWHLRNRPVGMLSAGQMTRVMLAKAFLGAPRICLLDEPTASLDPDIAHEVRAFIRAQQKENGVSMIYTSHNMEEITEVCERVIFLKTGKIIACDTPGNLAQTVSACKLLLTVESGQDALEEALRNRDLYFDNCGGLMSIAIDEQEIAPLLIQIANSSVSYSNVHIERPTLEQYFLSIAQEAA